MSKGGSYQDVEDVNTFAVSGKNSVEEISASARVATAHEHELTFFQALKLYKKAAGWSVFFSLGIIMTAFDPQLLGNLYAMPKFQRDFGYEYQGKYIISAPWQTGMSLSGHNRGILTDGEQV